MRPAKLLNRDFVLLWLGQAVSQLGSQIYVVALVLWIKRTTGSASLIALILMISSIPSVVLSGIGGTFADRHSRRKIIVYSDVLRGILVLSLAGLLYLIPQATETIIIWLMGVAVCMSVTVSFFVPAMSAAIPDLVPQDKITRANSLRQLTAQLSMFMGQGLGGILFRLWGAPLLVLVNGLSFLFAALSESFINIPQQVSERERAGERRLSAFRKDFLEGLRYVWKAPGLRRLFFFSAIFNFFTMPVIVLLPFYVGDFLKLKDDWYGYLMAIYGAGILVGSLSTGLVRLAGKVRGRVMIIFAVCNSLLIGSLGFTHSLTVVIVLAFLAGTLGAFNGINIATILQLSTPSEIRGRVFGLLHTLSGSIAPIGMGLGGLVFELTDNNIPLIYGSCGGIMALLSVLVSMSREFREFLAYQKAPTPQEVKEQAEVLSNGAGFSGPGRQVAKPVKEQLFRLARQTKGTISVDRLPDEITVALANIADGQAIYERLTSDFVSLGKLIERLASERRPYFIIMSIYLLSSNDHLESSGIIYIEGDSLEAVYWSENGFFTYSDALHCLFDEGERRLAAFNVYRANLGAGGVAQSAS
jgi:MFS family permease